MIFITVGSREYQFDRLIKAIDNLKSTGELSDEVFAQIGTAKYIPQNFLYKRFLSPEEFNLNQVKADIIVSHGGSGALISAVKKGKRVISVPRLKKYKEHSDNHQKEISEFLLLEGYISDVVYNTDDLLNSIIKAYAFEPRKFDVQSNIVKILDNYISST